MGQAVSPASRNHARLPQKTASFPPSRCSCVPDLASFRFAPGNSNALSGSDRWPRLRSARSSLGPPFLRPSLAEGTSYRRSGCQRDRHLTTREELLRTPCLGSYAQPCTLVDPAERSRASAHEVVKRIHCSQRQSDPRASRTPVLARRILRPLRAHSSGAKPNHRVHRE